jgi:hypothetical protein
MRDPKRWKNMHLFNDTFAKHCAEDKLPAFSWLEPRYYEFGDLPARDQHPSHSMHDGFVFLFV